MDLGITTSKKACFAFCLPGEYFNLTPLGYWRLHATFHGMGNRRLGSMPFHNHSWGVLLWGSKEIQLGEFDPNDPRHLSPRTLAAMKAAGKPLPARSPRFNDGLVRMLVQDNVGSCSSFYT